MQTHKCSLLRESVFSYRVQRASLWVGGSEQSLGGGQRGLRWGVHLGVSMLPCETMCIVLAVCVFASAVFAPTLMKGFHRSHHGKDCSHFTKECNPKTQYIACYACVIKVEVVFVSFNCLGTAIKESVGETAAYRWPTRIDYLSAAVYVSLSLGAKS